MIHKYQVIIIHPEHINCLFAGCRRKHRNAALPQESYYNIQVYYVIIHCQYVCVRRA